MFTTGGRKPQRFQTQIDGGYDVPAPSPATLQLTDQSGNVQALDGTTLDKEVRMPASDRDGVPFEIINVGATNALLLRTSTGAAISGATTQLAPGEAATVVSIDGTWRHLGIRSITL